MSNNLKQIIKQEYLKCAQDPVHFMKKYCYIQHPMKGKIPFNLYDFQEKTLREVRKNRYNIILNHDNWVYPHCLLVMHYG